MDSGTIKAETSGFESGHECHDQRKPSIASNSVKSMGGFRWQIEGFSSGVVGVDEPKSNQGQELGDLGEFTMLMN